MNKTKINIHKYAQCDLSNLTTRQREIFQLALKGKSYSDIAKELGGSRQNISSVIHCAIKRLESIQGGKPTVRKVKKQGEERKQREPRKKKYPYSLLARMDLSVLTNREREVLVLVSNGDKTHREIAEELAVSGSYIGDLLRRARLKLMGEYEPVRERQAEKQREFRKKMDEERREKRKKYASEYHKKYHRRKSEQINAYNKEYYQKHKEAILAKQKERRKAKE